MRIFVLSKKHMMGGSEILGLFSEFNWAKKAAEKRAKSFTWTQQGDVHTYMSDYTGPRPAYTITSYEVDPE